MDLADLRQAAHEIFDRDLQSVDAREAVQRAVRFEGHSLTIVADSLDINASGVAIYVLAIGKAALTMAHGINDVLGGQIARGIIAAAESQPQRDQNDPFGKALAGEMPKPCYVAQWKSATPDKRTTRMS